MIRGVPDTIPPPFPPSVNTPPPEKPSIRSSLNSSRERLTLSLSKYARR